MKSLSKFLGIFLVGIVCFLSSCDNMIYDDHDNCPTGLYLSFYNKTICAADTTYLTDFDHLHVLLFDSESNFIKEFRFKDAVLDSLNRLYMPIPTGDYQIAVWSGLDSQFKVTPVPTGSSKIDHRYAAALPLAGQINLSPSTQLLQGAIEHVRIPNSTDVGGAHAYAKVNLQEKTNRIRVTIELDKSVEDELDNFEVVIRSANGSYNVDGGMPLNQPQLTYASDRQTTDNQLIQAYTFLDLKSGYQNELIIRHKITEAIIYQADLMGSLLLKNENINLACTHDFDLKFTLKDKCADCFTYFCSGIWVNDWKIHSYETDLEVEY